ncbi:epoxyqueuosine reductase [Porphyromonas sp. HMSC077F02]|uniref:tRNA epoxyqueuosine(34) reductase QueG n=1 Tax=Porphyromonas sp. HMSC077F02 TaxID=1739529 RepID=UPI0008A59E29|nr:tRNA epoxyqueuosine(34) reductase QueG [Porphyromonas sp. HMSC077F02]OFO53447.1 epoxyqueuosine reductase [Porphyromonas sp. HMSC077F02]
MNPLNSQIRAIATEMGVDAVGFVPITMVSDSEIAVYKDWLSHGNHAGMTYLERYMEQRQHPQLLLPEASSVIILAVSYYPPQRQEPSAPKVAKYALGRDYHKVMKRLLLGLAERIHTEVAPHTYRAMVDTAPFLERYWAEQSGIGFIGQHRNLIVPEVGSFLFLGELLTSLRLENDQSPHPSPLSCHDCRRCLKACPTGALTEEGLNAHRCINYLTIEHRGAIPQELSQRFGRRFYGCDTCQDVCPYNHHPRPSSLFTPFPQLLHLERKDLEKLDEMHYARLFYGTAMTRAKLPEMQRNAEIYLSNNPE